MYEYEISFLKQVEDINNKTNEREKLSDEEISDLLEDHPDAPADYISYLKEIGWGSFRECQFMVYSFLGTLDDIIGDVYEFKENVFFFGDNFAGDLAGFHLDNGWEVVEFLHETQELNFTGLTFQKFIREQMLMDEQGNDTRIRSYK